LAHDVFISYSSADKATADAMCATLESKGIRCWIAPRDVLPGAEYAQAIVDGISESRMLVLLLSSHSNASPQVMREVERAVSKGIPILPFRIEDVILSKSMEYFVSSHHWLDALTPPLANHLNILADNVELMLGASPKKKLARDSGGNVLNSAFEKKARFSQAKMGWIAAGVLLIGFIVFMVMSHNAQQGPVTMNDNAPTNINTTQPVTSNSRGIEANNINSEPKNIDSLPLLLGDREECEKFGKKFKMSFVGRGPDIVDQGLLINRSMIILLDYPGCIKTGDVTALFSGMMTNDNNYLNIKIKDNRLLVYLKAENRNKLMECIDKIDNISQERYQVFN